MLHQLLPTASRVHRVNPSSSPTCRHCPVGSPEAEEDQEHALLLCGRNQGVGGMLLTILTRHVGPMSHQDVLHLNFQCPSSMELPVTWLILSLLSSVWERRKLGKMNKNEVFSDIRARMDLWRKSEKANIYFHSINKLISSL